MTHLAVLGTLWCIALVPAAVPVVRAVPPPVPVTVVRIASDREQAADQIGNGEDKLTRVVLWYIFKTAGILVGGMALYLGYRLFILGVTGKASLSVQHGSARAQLLNAAPGLFFALGGLALVGWAIWAK